MPRSKKPVLLVEDDRVDAMTLQRAFRELGIPNRLQRAGTGEEALALLRDPACERPCMVLLDLNMPRMGGLELLRHLKTDRDLRRIPVIVMTSSPDEQDRLDSFGLGAAGYMLKPAEYDQLVEVVRAIDRYWTLSELPPNGD
ncbi:MAG: response regulator [Thermodesulfobacteriota bacterium]